PVLTTTADAVAIDVGCDRFIFILGNQEDLVAAKGPVTHRPDAAGRGRKRTVEKNHALQIVETIVFPFRQMTAFEHPTGDGIADFHGHGLRTADRILALQEVGRSAGRAELVALWQRVGLRRIDRNLGSALAEFGAVWRYIDALRAVERAFVAQELRAGDVGLEISPHRMAVAAFDA